MTSHEPHFQQEYNFSNFCYDKNNGKNVFRHIEEANSVLIVDSNY